MLCDKCHRVFNGQLIEIRVHNNNRTHHWVVREPPSPAGHDSSDPPTHTTWEWLEKRLEAPSYTSYTIHARAPRPEFKIMTHHTLRDLLSSAKRGCPSCGLLAQESMDSVLGSQDIDTHNVRSIPIIVGRDSLSQDTYGPVTRGIPLQLRLWFVGEDDMVYCHWPGSRGPMLHIDLFGPCLNPTTERSGNIQEPTLTRLSNWVVGCEQHQDCVTRSNALRKIFPGRPSRLLQILDHGTEKQVRLVEYDNIKLVNGTVEYTTLSHCWGKGPSEQLSVTQYDRLTRGISWTVLPPTFRDAVEVTLALGFQFIWISALCIVQDSEQGWHREASRIGSVYANASVNIAATASYDSEQGLFLQEQAMRDKVIEVKWPKSAVNGDWYMLRPGSKTDPDASGFRSLQPRLPLDQRAWVFQERLFSPRLIEFDEHQIRWQCREHFANDLDRIQIYGSGDFPLEREDWATLVQGYMERRLTFQSERLVAFSAIAQAFSCLHNKENSDYLAGLWKQDILEQLLWRLKFPVEPSPETRMGQYYAPSWSWASLPNLDPKCFQFQNRNWSTENRMTRKFHTWGTNKWGSPDAEEGPIWQKNFTVLAAPIEPIGEDHFGALRGGHLVVECLSYPIKVDSTSGKKNEMVCSMQNQDGLLGVYHADYLEANPPLKEVFFVPLVLYLAFSHYAHGDGIFIDGLLLIPTSEAGTFKRIGVLEIQGLETIPSWWTIPPNDPGSENLDGQRTYLKQIKIV